MTDVDIEWAPTAFTHDETVFIFDWDDTLLCTSWLNYRGSDKTVTQEMLDRCAELSKIVKKILIHARLLGRIYIVTNSQKGWVEDSCSIFMPDLMKNIESIPIIYAQERNSKHTSPILWKQLTFIDELKGVFQGAKNIISIGDGEAEQEAMRSITRIFKGLALDVVTKSVKLIERSTPPRLIQQLNAVQAVLLSLTYHSITADMMFI
jgi:hypothetical protein